MCKLLDWIRSTFFGYKSSPALPRITWRSIPDPLAFIVQTKPDGSRATVHDLLTERRHDWPLPIGWARSESVLMDDGSALQAFTFVRPEHAAGNGGQVVKAGADGFVRSIATRDGGKSHLQYFVGEGVGGTGWIFFGVDAPTGMWRELVATLAESSWSGFKPAPADFGRAFTRYRLERVAFPFAFDGVTEIRTVETIISEHFDRDSIPGSVAMERSYFGKGYGLLRWEAWGRTVEPPIGDVDQRYQWVAYSDPPGEGWHLDDIRTYTNVVRCEPTPVPMMY
jgi:hypothetical protein